MKRFTILPFIVVALVACNFSPDKREARLRSHFPEKKMPVGYNPGFGDFMINIQLHHAKLWFAGTNENWRLADFERHEIEESVENIKDFKADRKETQLLILLDPLLDSLNHSIKTKNVSSFKNNYTLLTNGCNSCHRASENDFTVIKIPGAPPFANQSFRPE